MLGKLGLGGYLEKGTVSTRTCPRDDAPEACGNWDSVAVAGRGPASVRSSDSRYIFYWYLCDCVSACVFCFPEQRQQAHKSCPFQGGHKYIIRKGGYSDNELK